MEGGHEISAFRGKHGDFTARHGDNEPVVIVWGCDCAEIPAFIAIVAAVEEEDAARGEGQYEVWMNVTQRHRHDVLTCQPSQCDESFRQ